MVNNEMTRPIISKTKNDLAVVICLPATSLPLLFSMEFMAAAARIQVTKGDVKKHENSRIIRCFIGSHLKLTARKKANPITDDVLAAIASFDVLGFSSVVSMDMSLIHIREKSKEN